MATTQSEPARQVRVWRRVAVTLLITLVAVLTPVSVVGVWVRNQILDDNTYVATVAPLSSDPAVQASVSNFVTNQIFGNIDVQSTVDDALGPRAQVLVRPLAAQLDNFVSAVVLRVVQSDQFSAVWSTINRVAHHQVVNFLLDRGPFTQQGDSLVLDLGSTIQMAQAQLVAAGFDAAGRIPADRINRQFVIADVASLVRARDSLQVLQGVTLVLPFVTLGLLASAVALSWNRRRTLIVATLAMAAGLVVLAVGLNLARSAYLDQMSTRPNLAPGAAASMFDTIVRFLQNSIRTVFTICVLVALAAFLLGPSGVATRLRRRVGAWLDAARARTGEGGSPVGRWIGAHKALLRVAVLAIAALLLVFLERPTPAVVIGIAAGIVVLFTGIEIFGEARRRAQPRHPAG